MFLRAVACPTPSCSAQREALREVRDLWAVRASTRLATLGAGEAAPWRRPPSGWRVNSDLLSSPWPVQNANPLGRIVSKCAPVADSVHGTKNPARCAPYWIDTLDFPRYPRGGSASSMHDHAAHRMLLGIYADFHRVSNACVATTHAKHTPEYRVGGLSVESVHGNGRGPGMRLEGICHQ